MKKVLSMIIVLSMLLSLPLTFVSAEGETATTTPTTPERVPTDIVLRNTGALWNGDQFMQYDPSNANGVDTMFTCDGTYITPRANLVSPYTNAAPAWLVLQYREAMKGNYELSYQMKLGKTNSGQFINFFCWQDYHEGTGRDCQHFGRGTGLGLLTTVTNGKVSLLLRKFDDTSAKLDSTITGNPDAQVLKELNLTPAEGETAEEGYGVLNFTLKWENMKLTVTISNAADETMKNEVSFDLTGSEVAKTVLGSIKNPAGFAIDMKYNAKAEELPSFGKFKLTDLTVENAAPVEVVLDPAMRNNGKLFYQYDALASAGNDTVFTCDGEWFTPKPSMTNMSTGAASTNAVLQYRHPMTGDYDLSYQLKLGADKTEDIFTYFYWQDYVESGRAYQTSQRGNGLALRMQVLADGTAVLKLIGYDANGTFGQLANSAVTPILDTAAESVTLNMKLEWKKPVLKVTVTNAADASKVISWTVDVTPTQAKNWKGELVVTGEQAMSFVKETAGFGLLMQAKADAKNCASVGHISYVDYGAPYVDPDYTYPMLNKDNYSIVTEGDAFVRGEDGWFTRSDAKATVNAVIASKKETTYNYEMSFKMKLNADNTGRVGLWNVWDGKYSDSNFGYMFNLTATKDKEGKSLIEYRLARYAGSYSLANDLVTDETKKNTENIRLLEGQPANAELLIKVTVQDRTLKIDTCLANDPTKKVDTVVYDFSAKTERSVYKSVNRTLGFAIMDMAAQHEWASASYGDITYKSLPGEEPAEEPDTNDYGAILGKNDFKWNGKIDVTADNFLFYNYNGQPQYELFQIENGWLTRKNEGNLTNSKEDSVRVNAYANAQYKGVMDGSDYKLTFRVKGDANNHFRFSVLTRWEDKDDQSKFDFKLQTGYRIYFETIEVKEGEGDAAVTKQMLKVFCYRTGGGGYMAAVPATAENVQILNLDGIEAGKLEMEITLVMQGDLIVTEAHLASDPTKTTGAVAFDLTDDPKMLAKIDRTQGFCLVDSANESGFMPASFGEFKLWAEKAPTVGGGSDTDEDPDDNITTGPSEPDKKPGQTTEEPPKGDETKAPETESKGCKSGISMVPFFTVLALSAAVVTVVRRKKEN